MTTSSNEKRYKQCMSCGTLIYKPAEQPSGLDEKDATIVRLRQENKDTRARLEHDVDFLSKDIDDLRAALSAAREEGRQTGLREARLVARLVACPHCTKAINDILRRYL